MRPGGLVGLAGAPSRRTLHLRTVTPSFLCLASSSSSSSSSADASSLARKLYEQKNAGALPRLLATGALGLALGAGFPTALADVLRNQTGDASATLGLDIIGTAACFLFLQRDLRRRDNQIDTITKELELGAFSVRVPRRVGGTKEIKISAFQGARRVVVLYGSEKSLVEDLERAEVYRKRLIASRIVIVPVPSDAAAGKRHDALEEACRSRRKWCAMPAAPRAFATWLEPVAQGGTAYLTVGTNGAVRGSGIGRPRFDILLSSFPRNLINTPFDASDPVVDDNDSVMDEASADDAESEHLISISRKFYDALLEGNGDEMAVLWDDAPPSEYLTGAVRKGARQDPWSTVLREDRRPIGMRLSEYDATVLNETRAFVTVLETVANGSTLLATQTFERRQDGGWQICEHRTVPYGKDIVAKIALRCDARGCVALPVKTVASFKSDEQVPVGDETARMLARD